MTSGEPVTLLLSKNTHCFQTPSPDFVSSSVLPPPHGTSSHGCVALIFLPAIFLTIISVFLVYRTVQCSETCRTEKIQLVIEVTFCTDKDQICNGLSIWFSTPNKFVVPRESVELKLKVGTLDEQVPSGSIYEQRYINVFHNFEMLVLITFWLI